MPKERAPHQPGNWRKRALYTMREHFNAPNYTRELRSILMQRYAMQHRVAPRGRCQ